MSATVVTKLVVDAGAAKQGEAEFTAAMARAENAQARLVARMAAVDAAMARGAGVMTASVTPISRVQRAFESLQAKVLPGEAQRLQQQREIERAVIAASNAYASGHATQEAALRAVIALEAQHANKIEETTGATLRLAAANRTAVASRGIGGGFQTSNIAAQFQDIGVTSAMGMSPMMIALQQGTQLSAVLGGQGLTGVVKSLGAAFAAILSPVSLITIGVVALAATGIQWAASLFTGTEKANDALEEHRKWLDEVLAGYKDVADAASTASESAYRLPERRVETNLQAELVRADRERAASLALVTAAQAELNRYVVEWQTSLQEMETRSPDDTAGPARLQALIDQGEELAGLAINAGSSASQIELLVDRARELMAVAGERGIRDWSAELVNAGDQMEAAEGKAYVLRAALATLQNADITIAVNLNTDQALQAIANIKAEMPELRSPAERAKDALNEALGSGDAVLRQMAEIEYARTTAGLQTKEQMDLDRKAASAAASSANSQIDAYASVVDGAKERIAAAELEQRALGMTADAANRLRIESDLLNRATANGATITAAQAAELGGLAASIAAAEAQTRAMTDAQAQQAKVIDVMADALGSLFDGPIEDADEFFDKVLGGLAVLGKGDLSALFDANEGDEE